MEGRLLTGGGFRPNVMSKSNEQKKEEKGKQACTPFYSPPTPPEFLPHPLSCIPTLSRLPPYVHRGYSLHPGHSLEKTEFSQQRLLVLSIESRGVAITFYASGRMFMLL